MEETRELTAREIVARDGYALTASGLKIIKKDLNKDEWMNILMAIGRRQNGYLWALGDWLVEGAREDREWSDEASYRKAAEITGYSEAHLRGCYRVSKAYPPETRNYATTWAIYREVLRVNEQMRAPILSVAAERGWTHAEVALHIDDLPDTALAVAKRNGRGRRRGRRNGTTSRSCKRKTHALAEVKCPAVNTCPSCGTQFACGNEFPVKGNKVKRRTTAKEPEDDDTGSDLQTVPSTEV